MKHKLDGIDAVPRVAEQYLCVMNRRDAGSISSLILKTKAECPEFLNKTSFSLNWASKYERKGEKCLKRNYQTYFLFLLLRQY